MIRHAGAGHSLSRGSWLLLLLLQVTGPTIVFAQEPIVRVEIEETETIPGQSLSVRMTVLVPTFMPSPPVWPSFEAPNLAIRVASTGPVSERIDGASWAGISRRYLLSPMVPGTFDLPAQSIGVTWADPETNAPRRSDVTTDPVTIAGIVPPGAEGLDPFLAANALELTQTIEGDTEGLSPGASVVRTVSATVQGTAPMFLPALLPPHQIEGMRAYADQPVVEEFDERGTLSGTRTERVTLIAEGGGAGVAPDIEVQWFNLSNQSIETATLEGFSVSIEGPPAASMELETRDWASIARIALAVLLAFGLLGLAWRKLAPPIGRWCKAKWASWQNSEPVAFRALQRSVRRRDLQNLFPALETWAARVPGTDPMGDPALLAALARLGQARYGRGEVNKSVGWHTLAQALPGVRQRSRVRQKAPPLPPLNPHTTQPC